MADRHLEPDSPELRARWGGWVFNPAWEAKAKAAVNKISN